MMYMLVQEEEGGRSYVSSDVNNSRNKISRYISNFPRFSFPSSTNHRREDLSHRGVESSFLRVLSSLLIGIIASYPSLSIFNSSRSNFPLEEEDGIKEGRNVPARKSNPSRNEKRGVHPSPPSSSKAYTRVRGGTENRCSFLDRSSLIRSNDSSPMI